MSFASKGFVISEIEKRIAASGGGGGITLSGTVTAANSTTLDLTATGALAFGTSSSDVRLKKLSSGVIAARLGDDSSDASVLRGFLAERLPQRPDPLRDPPDDLQHLGQARN